MSTSRCPPLDPPWCTLAANLWCTLAVKPWCTLAVNLWCSISHKLTSFSTPPFSWASAGRQNSAAKRQCERNAMKRAVSSRRNPRRIRLTALVRLS